MLNGCTIRSGTFGGLQQVNIITDTNLNVLKCHKLDVGVPEVSELISMSPTDDGGFISSVDVEQQSDIILVKVSYDGVIEWKRRYIQNDSQTLMCIKPTSDKGVVGLTRFYSFLPTRSWVFKTDSLGLTAGCNMVEPYALITSPPFTQSPTGLSTTSFTLPVYSITSNNVAHTLQQTTICENVVVPSCTVLAISGEDSICNLSI